MTRDRPSRKAICKLIQKVRGYKRWWLFENKVSDMTANRRSMAKTPSTARIRLSKAGSAAKVRGEFRAFWNAILTGPATPPLGGEPLGPSDRLTPTQRVATDCAENATLDVRVSHEDFVHPLMMSPKNKAGSEDGVLGEYLAAISPEQAGLLLHLLTDALLGRVLLPPSWRRAVVTLIPKLAGASLAKQYRPIKVLPVLQKLALRCWLSAALPFLELRSQASHGFGSGFQAAELQAVARMIFEKRIQWGPPRSWRR